MYWHLAFTDPQVQVTIRHADIFPYWLLAAKLRYELQGNECQGLGLTDSSMK
jgi:hypothetical protein